MERHIDNIEFHYEESPFTNHLVLIEIKKYLDLKDLKTARIVNKLWHLIFSKWLEFNFNSQDNFAEFLKIQSWKNDNCLDTPIQSLNLSFDKISDVFLKTSFSQLAPIYSIKKLTIYPNLNSILVLKSIIESVGPTLEFLEAGQPDGQYWRDAEMFFKIRKAQNLPFLLPNLKTLKFTFYSYGTNLDQDGVIESSFGLLFQDFLQAASSSLTEIELFEINSFSVQGLLKNNLPKLKDLKILTFYMDNEPINFSNISNFILAVEKNKVEKIQILEDGEVDLELNWKDFRNFIKIVSLYNENWKNFKDPKEIYFIQSLRLYSITIFDNSDIFNIPLDKVFWLFPYLKNLHDNLSDKNWIKKLNYYSKLILLENLDFTQYKCNQNYFNLIPQIIVEKFPNFKKLRLELQLDINEHSTFVSKRLKFVPIFTSLVKLEELSLDDMTFYNFIPDEDLTGIPEEFIKKELRGKSYEFLRDFDLNSLPKRHHIGIANLKGLHKFVLGTGICDFTFSLFYGFRFLTKLDHLKIFWRNKFVQMPDEYLRIFIDDYPKLDYLSLFQLKHKGKKEFVEIPIFQEIKAKRTQVKLEIEIDKAKIYSIAELDDIVI